MKHNAADELFTKSSKMEKKIDDIPHDVPGLWEDYVRHCQERGLESPRVVIHGGYGKKNTGDDAILHVLISRIRHHLPNAMITVVCHGPDNVKRWYPDTTTCHFKSLSAFKAIAFSDIYIIGGGGIINKINIYSGFKTFRIFDMKGKFLFFAAYLAKVFGAKSHFYAIGATSFPDPLVKLLSRIVLSQADVVSVRDPLSVKNIKELGVSRELILVLDPALCLEPAPSEKANRILQDLGLAAKAARSRPLIGINVRYVDDPEVDNEQSLNETARLVEYLVREKQCDVLFLPISQHPSKHLENDLDFGRQVKSRLENMSRCFILQDYVHPQVMMALMGEMDFMILSRLHSVILGWKMNVPVFAISYDNKVAEFVKLIGREDMLVELADFGLGNVRPLIAPEIDNIVASRGPGPSSDDSEISEG